MLRPWNLLILTFAGCLLCVSSGQAQVPSGGIGFKNDTKTAIIIQGASKVNNMVRQGPPIVILPGRIGFEGNIPAGIRLITVYEASQPPRILLQGKPVNFQGRDLFFSVQPMGPNRVDLIETPLMLPR